MQLQLEPSVRGTLKFPRSGHLARPLPSATYPLRFSHPALFALGSSPEENKQQLGHGLSLSHSRPLLSHGLAWAALQAGSENVPLKLPLSSLVLSIGHAQVAPAVSLTSVIILMMETMVSAQEHLTMVEWGTRGQ